MTERLCACEKCLGRAPTPKDCGCDCPCHVYAAVSQSNYLAQREQRTAWPHMWYANRTLCCPVAYISLGDRHMFHKKLFDAEDGSYPPDGMKWTHPEGSAFRLIVDHENP